MNRFFARPNPSWSISAIIATGLLLGALFVPLWKMELVAPQYPKGLVMRAYGYKFVDDPQSPYDDVREINGLNHYIGMKPIEEVTEMSMFIPGVLALAAGTILVSFVAWKRRWLRTLIALGFWTMPVFFVADLQWWLYHYGHTMHADAALNTGDFTPKVIGSTKVWNFHSETSFEIGFYLLVAAALVITLGPVSGGLFRRLRAAIPSSRRAGAAGQRAPARGATAVLKILLPLAILATAGLATYDQAGAQDSAGLSLSLQERIDAAAPEDIIVVQNGVYHERIVVDKPLSLIGRDWPVIDGDGQGDVVTISADDVVFSGFEVRGSSKTISTEPAAIKVADANAVKINGNRVRDSYFALHMTASDGSTIEDNDFRAGTGVPEARRGHAMYLWNVMGSTIHRNIVRDAADGIHLEFSEDNLIVENDVRDSRYALHFMTAHRNKIVRNEFVDNLAGAVLMFSHELIVTDNEFSSNRAGATGTGMLLKDDDNFFAEGNRMLRNKYGMTIEGTPQTAGTTAIIRRNLLALNDVGVSLTSNSPITFVENAVIDNGVQVRAQSGSLAHGAAAGATAEDASKLPRGAVWTSAGRGNYWSDYRGFDADGNGTGDQPYRPRPAFAGQLDDDDTLRLFQYTVAQQAIDLAADLFPVFRYDAVMEDSGPLMSPPDGLGMAHGTGVNVRLLIASAALAAASMAAIAGLAGIRLPARAARARPSFAG